LLMKARTDFPTHFLKVYSSTSMERSQPAPWALLPLAPARSLLS
jgi:hypothetical protein